MLIKMSVIVPSAFDHLSLVNFYTTFLLCDISCLFLLSNKTSQPKCMKASQLKQLLLKNFLPIIPSAKNKEVSLSVKGSDAFTDCSVFAVLKRSAYDFCLTLLLICSAYNRRTIPLFCRRSGRCPSLHRHGYGEQHRPYDSVVNRLYRVSVDHYLY